MSRKSFRLSVLEECIEATLEEGGSHDFYMELFDVLGYFSHVVLREIRPTFTSVVHAASIVEVFYQRHPNFRNGINELINQRRDLVVMLVAYSEWVDKNEKRKRVGAKTTFDELEGIAKLLSSTSVEDWHLFSSYVFCSLTDLPADTDLGVVVEFSNERHSAVRMSGRMLRAMREEVSNG